MSHQVKRLLYWAPRILCILFALFLSLFALDVIAEGLSFREVITALLVHLIPVYIVVIALIIAWKWEWVGAIVFFALAALYAVLSWGRFHWSAYAAISGPLVLLGVLFLAGWIYRAQLRGK